MATFNDWSCISTGRSASPLKTKQYEIAWVEVLIMVCKLAWPREIYQAKSVCSCPPSFQGLFRGLYQTPRLICLWVHHIMRNDLPLFDTWRVIYITPHSWRIDYYQPNGFRDSQIIIWCGFGWYPRLWDGRTFILFGEPMMANMNLYQAVTFSKDLWCRCPRLQMATNDCNM